MDVRHQIDDFLVSREDGGRPAKARCSILLIDGPAGIGKTKFIEFLALDAGQDASRPLNVPSFFTSRAAAGC